MKKKLISVCACALAAATLFAGCSKTYEIDFDTDFGDIDEEDILEALDAIGFDDYEEYEDGAFSFTGSQDYDYDIDIDAETDVSYFSYVKCSDEETAKALFEYYYENTYEAVIDGDEDLSGRSASEFDGNECYVIIHGSVDEGDTTMIYHDLLLLKGDMVLIAMSNPTESSEIVDSRNEINTFLDSLGYPNP